MEADADAQRLGQVVGELAVEPLERERHGARRRERLAARRVGSPSTPNSAMMPSPMNLSTRPPSASTAWPMARKY